MVCSHPKKPGAGESRSQGVSIVNQTRKRKKKKPPVAQRRTQLLWCHRRKKHHLNRADVGGYTQLVAALTAARLSRLTPSLRSAKPLVARVADTVFSCLYLPVVTLNSDCRSNAPCPARSESYSAIVTLRASRARSDDQEPSKGIVWVCRRTGTTDSGPFIRGTVH